jgi:hypothetical protein
MTDTNDLINQLAQDAKPAKAPLKPRMLALQLVAVLGIYALGAQWALGIRPDIILRLTEFWYEAELVLLLFLVLTSALASIMSMYPDALQKPALLKLPYVVFGSLLLLVLGQYFFMSPDGLAMTGIEINGIACAICIAAVSIIPSALMFAFLRRGATIHPLQAGAFAVFTAAGIGMLTLRIAEPNDVMLHLAIWHYLPTFLFAMLGAALGRWLLKW